MSKQRNYVAKNCLKFNRGKVFRDRTKYNRKQKHRRDLDAFSLTGMV